MKHSVQLAQGNPEYSAGSSIRPLAVIFVTCFLALLLSGMTLGLLPEYIHSSLGYGDIVVGTFIGTQYLVTLLSRQLTGKIADTRGGGYATRLGLLICFLSGAFLLLSVFLEQAPAYSLGVLFLSRILLGAGESLLIVGISAWGFSLVGTASMGKLLVWIGMGMVAGQSAGAPLGVLLANHFGLVCAVSSLVVIPLFAMGLIRTLPQVRSQVSRTSVSFFATVKKIWRPGCGLALAGIGFGCIASFSVLYFASMGWRGAALTLTAYGSGYIFIRLFFAYLPDKFGGAMVGTVCLLVIALGQVLMAAAPSSIVAVGGAAITGMGYSLVYPSFGLIAISYVKPENRGTAVAAFSAFFDISVGVTAPVAGVIATIANYRSVFAFGTLAALTGAAIAYTEWKRSRAGQQPARN